jgi:hypothetical protein
VTVKSRLIPFSLRPSAPLLASSALLSAYNHANNPTTFDMKASSRESLEAYNRCHPGVGSEEDITRIKAEKAAWNEQVNWVMNERRVEKLWAIEAERTKRLREVAKVDGDVRIVNGDADGDDCPRKRRMTATVPLPFDSPGLEKSTPDKERGGIFRVPWLSGKGDTRHERLGSPLQPLSGHIRPGLLTPTRPMSPRRIEKKRGSISGIYTGVGELSPRGRGTTYTPPRILPSGDETAPTGSPVPSLQNFDFVSPLGPVKSGRLTAQRQVSLEAVKEEPGEEGDDAKEGEWTLVQPRGRRGGSAPCREKAGEMGSQREIMVEGEGMRMD